MMMRTLIRYVITLGPVGFLPAPGTFATLVTMSILYGLNFAQLTSAWQLFCIALIFVMSFWLVQSIHTTFAQHDPSYVVIDEVVGSVIAVYALPQTWIAYLLALCVFRLFDIAKPFGIARAEQLPGATGIILDDVLAGILANVVVRALHEVIF